MNGVTYFKNKVNFLQQSFLYLLVGVGVGMTLVFIPAEYFLLAVVGCGVLVGVCRKPEVGVLIIFLMTSSIVFQENMPMLPIGIGSLHLTDIVLVSLLGTIFIRRYTGNRESLVRTPVDIPLLLFYVTAVFTSAIAVKFGGLDATQMIRGIRPITYYLVFFVATNLIRDKKQLNFIIRGLFISAAIVAIAMVLQVLVGDSIQLIPGRVEQANAEYDALRILPPGETQLYYALVVTLCLSVVREISVVRLLPLTMLYGVGILLTYNRSFWVAILLTIAILLLTLSAKCKKRILVYLTMVAISGFFTVTAFKGKSMVMDSYHSMSDRFVSLFGNDKLLKSESLEYRYLENHYALKQIAEHPALGIGVGKAYRPILFGADDELDSYMHNGYLWLVTDVGIVGFLFFIWFYFGFIFRGLRNWKSAGDERLRALVVGFTMSSIGMLFVAVVNPVFMEGNSIVVIALFAGLIETAVRLNNPTNGVRNGC